MQKYWKTLLILVLFISSLVLTSFESKVSASANDDAEYLYELGLFKGTDKGFELERKAVRIEALVMLVRLLGLEESALQSTADHPFDDVPDWADRYVAFSYAQGLTSGISDSKFGSQLPVTDQQYFTFILRALQYDDRQGDFEWSQARQKAIELGIVESGSVWEQYLTRSSVVSISRSALSAQLNGRKLTLLEQLIVEGAIGEDASPYTYEIIGDRVVMSMLEVGAEHSISQWVMSEAFPEAVHWYTRHLSIIEEPFDISQFMLTLEKFHLYRFGNANENTAIDSRTTVTPDNDNVQVEILLDQRRKLIAYAYGDDIDYELNQISWRTEIPDDYYVWKNRFDISLETAVHIPSEDYHATTERCGSSGDCIQFFNPSVADHPILEKAVYFYQIASMEPFVESNLEINIIEITNFIILNKHMFQSDSVIDNFYNTQRGVYHLSYTEPYRMHYYLDEDLNIIAYTYWDLTD